MVQPTLDLLYEKCRGLGQAQLWQSYKEYQCPGNSQFRAMYGEVTWPLSKFIQQCRLAVLQQPKKETQKLQVIKEICTVIKSSLLVGQENCSHLSF